MPNYSWTDLVDVLSTASPSTLVVVGGQSVNIWATVYRSSTVTSLDSFGPFVSKDLDILGSQEILYALARKFDVAVILSEPRTPGIGCVNIPRADSILKVELLRGVYGLAEVRPHNMVKVRLPECEIHVLDPVSCLRAKIANAADLDQSTRQDFKHVQIMTFCAREYVKELLARRNVTPAGERLIVTVLHELAESLTDSRAGKVSANYCWNFEQALPTQEITSSEMEKVKNFVQHQMKGILSRMRARKM